MSQITPRGLGYRMPAEWEPQDAIWLSWPHNEVTWPDGMLTDLIADNKIPYELNRRLSLRMFEPGIVLEGGSIEVNGAGAVLTTEQCLLNKNRNPKLSREEIENYLKDYLNVSKVFWLKEGIIGDDTDGHIDDIARFVDAKTVVCAIDDDPC